MKKLNKKLHLFSTIKMGGFMRSMTIKSLILLSAVVFVASGCKKDSTSTNSDRDYGYAKVTIACEGKCHVTYGTADKPNEFDVEKTTAIYYIRYQRNYILDINVTPVDVDQNITLSAYSREEKQIFRNNIFRKVGDTWNNKITIP